MCSVCTAIAVDVTVVASDSGAVVLYQCVMLVILLYVCLHDAPCHASLSVML